MGYELTIEPLGQTIEVEDGQTILDAALRAGIYLPHACCHGLCATCKVQVTDGEVDHGEASTFALMDFEREEGKCLACCARLESDTVIEAEIEDDPDSENLPVEDYRGEVVRIETLTPTIKGIWLKLDRPMHFQAGQYINLEIPALGGVSRAFSLANAPHDDACLQLHIRHVPGGQFTDHVFSTMRERDMLRFNGPHGCFFLDEESLKPVLLVAGGTGFAPIKAIVEHAIAEGSTRPMAIYWGGHGRVDLYQLSLAEKWALEHAHIDFVPVLSDRPENEIWRGRRGFVHAAAMTDFPDLSGHQVYVCGSPAMVLAARRDFVGQCRLPETEFFADSFEFANDAGRLPTASTIAD